VSQQNANDELTILAFFINTIKAVNDHEVLLRAAIATASNDHRLELMKHLQQLFLFLLEHN
jgi:glutamine synthetase type III